MKERKFPSVAGCSVSDEVNYTFPHHYVDRLAFTYASMLIPCIAYH